jgi:hypothetical protein
MPIPPFDRKKFPGYTDSQWKLLRIGWNHARKAARAAITSEQTTAAYELLRDSEFPPPGILRMIAPDGTLTLRPIPNGWMHGERDIGPAPAGAEAHVAPCTDNPKATCQQPDDCARYGCLAAPADGVVATPVLRYYCPKCRSFPASVNHNRPDGSECPYLARVTHGVIAPGEGQQG